METVHQQQGSNRRSRHQQRLSSMPTQATQRQQSQPAKRSYLSKLQIACILFAAFAYRLASEHQSDWELVPTAYFDLDGEANADFVAKQFLLTPVPAQFNSANKLKGEHGKQPELNEMAWISHAGDGWLVGLDRQPLKTSLRTLASWPHRVLAQLPDIGADAGMGRMPLALETATVGKQLFVVAQSSSGHLHVYSLSDNQELGQRSGQLKHLYSLNPLSSLHSMLLSSYVAKPLSMTIIRTHCRQGSRVFTCLLMVAAYRLVDKSGPIGFDLNQTAADLLPPVLLAFNLNNGSLVWQNYPHSSSTAEQHD
uniref:WD40 repeat domain-containing protein n=1 Tax=Macrostomum lignano TaxID=282301 RepID=A0A1I8GT94_9PLAT